MKIEVKKKGAIMYQTEEEGYLPSDERVASMRDNDYITYVDGKEYNPAKSKKNSQGK